MPELFWEGACCHSLLLSVAALWQPWQVVAGRAIGKCLLAPSAQPVMAKTRRVYGILLQIRKICSCSDSDVPRNATTSVPGLNASCALNEFMSIACGILFLPCSGLPAKQCIKESCDTHPRHSLVAKLCQREGSAKYMLRFVSIVKEFFWRGLQPFNPSAYQTFYKFPIYSQSLSQQSKWWMGWGLGGLQPDRESGRLRCLCGV